MSAWLTALLIFMGTLIPVGVVMSYTYMGTTYTIVGTNGSGSYHGVPGPLAGAGLPALIVASGAFWAFRKYKKKSD